MSLYRPKESRVWVMDFMFHGQRIRETTEMTSITRAREVFEKGKQGLKDCAAGIASIKKTQPLLFATAAEEFIALAKGKKRKWAPRMLEIQKNSVAHLLPVFGKKLLLGIEGKHIVAYQEQRTLQGASGRTVNIEIATLRAILKRFKQWERLQDDVVMLEERSDIGHALTAEEESALLMECGRSAVAFYCHLSSWRWKPVLGLIPFARYSGETSTLLVVVPSSARTRQQREQVGRFP